MKIFNKKEALKAILLRPAMYMGNTQHPFTAVLCYLRGLDTGFGLGAKDWELGVFPYGLHEWATKKLHWHHPSQRWDDGLLEECGGDEAMAFEKYRGLILEYLREHADD